jgi:hypothetical protein
MAMTARRSAVRAPEQLSDSASSAAAARAMGSLITVVVLALDSACEEAGAGAPAAFSLPMASCLIPDTSASICERSSTILFSSTALLDSSSTKLAPSPRFIDTSSSSGFFLPAQIPRKFRST